MKQPKGLKQLQPLFDVFFILHGCAISQESTLTLSRLRTQLENYEFLLKKLDEKRGESEGKLRFNRTFIIASDIAEQYFCEKKVEMKYLHGEIVTEAKTVGTEAHERLVEDAVEVKKEEFWEKIYAKKPVFALELLLVALYDDVILAGRPDSVLFQNGEPRIVFEFKFSRSGIAYPSHHVQARTYGLLLENMGFNTDNLFYSIVVADPASRGDPDLQQKVMNAINEKRLEETMVSIENANVYHYKFDRIAAEKNLNWALDFWKKSREALPATNSNKCLNCEYQTKCSRNHSKEHQTKQKKTKKR